MPNLEEAERRLMDAQKKLTALMIKHGHGDTVTMECLECWRASRSLLSWDRKVRMLRREAAERARLERVAVSVGAR